MAALLEVAISFIAGAIKAWSYIALSIVAFVLWNVWYENPRIREEARAGYVLEVSAAAANAELDERKRQAASAMLAAENLRKTVEAQKATDEASLEAQRKDLKDYAASIKTQKRSCPITDDDIRWLRK